MARKKEKYILVRGGSNDQLKKQVLSDVSFLFRIISSNLDATEDKKDTASKS